MGLIQGGAFRLFRVAGIDVFLHWTWLVAALYSIQSREGTPFWRVAEYVSLFGIVLLHEFGHAFACRSVGGTAERIMLWPLGGIAFVSPPPRPGAVLWSIAAGPLVNVVLAPITIGAFLFVESAGWKVSNPDEFAYLKSIASINAVLLIFNLMPFYPLDGGQIVQSLLWFVVGRGRSLIIAGWIGTLAGAAFVVPAFMFFGVLPAVIAIFLMMQAWSGVRTGKFLRRLEALPRRHGTHCPICGESPVLGKFWLCEQCRQPLDLFENQGICPSCGRLADGAPCPHCGRTSPLNGTRRNGEEAQVWQA